MTTRDWNAVEFRKASFSQASGACVEVARIPEGVAVRDSKQHGSGPVLVFTDLEWRAFLAGVRAGEFDL